MTDGLILLLGVGLAAGGGDLFVRGAVGVAAGLRVPPGIIGATVVAFATSSPELTVAVNAAVSGRTVLALGDAMGSNVVNVALVLGVALAIAGIRPDRRDVRRDLPVAAAAPAIVGLLILDGRLSRLDGAVLLVVFAAWLTTTILQALRGRDAAADVLGGQRLRNAAIQGVIGLLLLVVAGRLMVVAARGLGEALGLDVFVVGATLVAFGTSVPELATTLMARLRRHDEVALGTVLGSNVFNSLWIVGLAAVLAPIDVKRGEVVPAIVAGVVATLLLIPDRTWWLSRWRGGALVVLYAVYLPILLTLRA